MNKQHFINAINDYVNSSDCEGAFYIDGKWGSGKTHFIKNYQKEINEKHGDRYVPYCSYTSLFGMHSISSLEKIVSGHAPTNERLSKLIVLDDFERCSIDVQELFAYITYLVEECLVKVILIGNDDEVVKHLEKEAVFKNNLLAAILSKDETKFNEVLKTIPKQPLQYNLIKEKSISKTAFFPFDVNVLFDEIVAKYDSKTQSLISRNKSNIKAIIRKMQCTNLRTCKSAIDSFLQIVEKIKNKNKRLINDLVRKNILLCSFAYTIAYKNGEAELDLSDNIFLSLFVRPMPHLEMYITKLIWDECSIIEEIESIKKTFSLTDKNNVPTVINKLNEYWVGKSDQELTENVKELIQSIKDDRLPHQYYYKTLSILDSYYEYGFDELISLGDITDIMVKNINNSDHVEKNEHDMAYDYMPKTASAYKTKLTAAFKSKTVSYSKNNVTKILSRMDQKSTQEIMKYESDFRNNKCFFSIIDIAELFKSILEATPQGIIHLRTCISNIYSFSNLYDFYPNDYDNVTTLKKMLESYDFSETKIKKRSIEWLIGDLEKYEKQLIDPSLDW